MQKPVLEEWTEKCRGRGTNPREFRVQHTEKNIEIPYKLDTKYWKDRLKMNYIVLKSLPIYKIFIYPIGLFIPLCFT